MESGRLFFDPSACKGNMLFLGNGDSIFRGSRTMMMNMEESSRRQPFFSSPDELFDDEYYEEQSPEKKRRLTSEQVHMLEKSFEVENKLEPERKTQLAKKLGLQPRQVAVWFQNRRARWKTKQLERDYDLLKSSYDSLLSDYESTVKDNDKLKSEVISLTEKVQAKEVGTGGQESEALVVVPPGDAQMMSVKLEDSGGSGVVDEDGPQIVDSGDSCFPNHDYNECMAMAAADEEDEGSDDGQSYYLSDNAFAPNQNNNEDGDGEPLQWWVWS